MAKKTYNWALTDYAVHCTDNLDRRVETGSPDHGSRGSMSDPEFDPV